MLGGGFAGLNCAALLRSALPDASITIVSDDDSFVYRPGAIYIPFGSTPDAIAKRIRPRTASRNVSLLKERVYEIEPSRKIVVTLGRVIDYDFLVVATGASSSPREIDGLADNAINLWTLGDMVRLGQRLRHLSVDAGNGRRQEIVLVVAQGAECSWPVYEMAFMLDTWLRRHRLRGLAGITLATYEDVHLAPLGPAIHERVARELEERGIDAHLGGFIHRVRHDRVVLRSKRRLPFDLLIAMPPHVASTKFESLPSDERRFLRINTSTCAVHEHPDIFAVGDCNELPVKQAAMAVAQASVAANNIVALARGEPCGTSFEPNSFCIVEGLDTATYVQAPMAFVGDMDRPVGIRGDALMSYRVGSGQIWRAANRAIAHWVPSRLRHLQPIRLGTAQSRGTEGMLRAAALFSKPVATVEPSAEEPDAKAA